MQKTSSGDGIVSVCQHQRIQEVVMHRVYFGHQALLIQEMRLDPMPEQHIMTELSHDQIIICLSILLWAELFLKIRELLELSVYHDRPIKSAPSWRARR